MLICANATAQEKENRWYVGGGAGAAKVRDLCRGIPDRFCEDTGAVIQAFGGWRVNRYFALEAAFNFSSGFVSPGARAVGYDGDTSVTSFGVNGIGFIPVSKRVSLLAGLSGAFGLATTEVSDYRYRSSSDCDWYWDSWDDDWEYYCRNNNHRDEYESDASLALGALVGVEVQLTSRLYLRAQAQRFFDLDGELAFLGERDVDFLTANVLFQF